MPKTAKHTQLFAIEEQYEKLHQLNNFLVRLNQTINWYSFRGTVSDARTIRLFAAQLKNEDMGCVCTVGAWAKHPIGFGTTAADYVGGYAKLTFSAEGHLS